MALICLVAGETIRRFIKGDVLGTLGDWIPFLIWFLAMANIFDVARGCHSPFTKLASILLDSRAAMFFGRISYSLYLLHVPIIIAVQYLIVQKLNIPDSKTCVLYTALFAIPLTIGISALSYRYIEQPFIALGRRLKP